LDKGKIVSIEDRIPKLKQQRKKKANKRLIFLLMLFFLLIGCIIYFQSPLSNVKETIVTGNILYTEGEIEEISGISSSTNIWTIKKDKIEEKLNALPEIKSSSVSLKLPNKVNIEVEEYKRIAYMVSGNKYIPILESGTELEGRSSESTPYDAPLIMDFDNDKALEKTVKELKKLPAGVYNAISEIHYTPKKTDSYHINVFMNDGFEVAASLSTFAEKMEHYPSIISQLNPKKKGVIDLEVGSYFKEYGSSEGEENSEE